MELDTLACVTFEHPTKVDEVLDTGGVDVGDGRKVEDDGAKEWFDGSFDGDVGCVGPALGGPLPAKRSRVYGKGCWSISKNEVDHPGVMQTHRSRVGLLSRRQ